VRITLFSVGILLIVGGLLILLAPGAVVAPILYDHPSNLLPVAAVLVIVGSALSVVAAKFLDKN